MADTKDTKDAGDDLIGGTKYVSLAEYKDLLESCHNLEQRLAEKTKILHKKKRFESVAIMLALWGTTALVLSECDYRRNSGSAPVDNGNAGAGGYESEDDHDSEEHGCYGPKTVGELKEKMGELEKKLEDCRMRNEELSHLPKYLPKTDKPVTCPPVKECPYIKQY